MAKNYSDEMKEAFKWYAKVMKVSEKEAKEDAESTIAMMMKDNGYSREFAENTWIEDTMDLTSEGMDAAQKEALAVLAKMPHAKAQRSKDAFGKEHVRVRKPNEPKRAIMALLESALQNANQGDEEDAASHIENVVLSNVERQVDFVLDGVNYSITLTAHRAPKEGK